MPSLRQDILSGQVQDSGIVLLVVLLTQTRIAVRVKQETTILELKEMIRSVAGSPVEVQYFVCRGRRLESYRRVTDYGLRTEDYIHVLLPIWGVGRN